MLLGPHAPVPAYHVLVAVLLAVRCCGAKSVRERRPGNKGTWCLCADSEGEAAVAFCDVLAPGCEGAAGRPRGSRMCACTPAGASLLVLVALAEPLKLCSASGCDHCSVACLPAVRRGPAGLLSAALPVACLPLAAAAMCMAPWCMWRCGVHGARHVYSGSHAHTPVCPDTQLGALVAAEAV